MLAFGRRTPRTTWAARPTATSVSEGTLIYVTDLDVFMFSDGTNWKPVGGRMTLSRGVTEVAFSNISPNTTINMHKSISVPAGLVIAGCLATVDIKWAHTASTNAKHMRVYLNGSAGTQMTNYNNTTAGITNTDVSWGIDFITSSGGAGTQLGKSAGMTGHGVSGSAGYTGAVDTTAEFTIDIMSNMGATTETMTMKSYSVELIFP